MQLLRVVGFIHGNMVLLSSTLGAGILFVSPNIVLKYSSLTILVSLSIWAGCGLLNMMNALCLAELATTFPVSGAPYYFLKRSFGSSVAFLGLWIQLFGHFLGIGALSLLMAGNLVQFFYSGCPAPELPKKCLALAVLWSLGILNARGIKRVAQFQTLSSLMKMAVLCFISLTGIVLLVIGKKENVSRFENALDAELPDASQIAGAILQVNYSYLGASLLITIATKCMLPRETMPMNLISGISTLAVLYILTNASYLTALSPQKIISSDSVAGTWIDTVFPTMEWIISFVVSASTLKNASCAILAASRTCYSASQGQLPFIFPMLNNYHCPDVAVTKIICSSIVVIPSRLVKLIKYLMLASSILTELSMIALLKLRYQEPSLHRPYKVVTQAIDINLATDRIMTCEPKMAISDSTEPRHWHGPGKLHGLLTSTWPVAWPMDINVCQGCAGEFAWVVTMRKSWQAGQPSYHPGPDPAQTQDYKEAHPNIHLTYKLQEHVKEADLRFEAMGSS
ncbi:solute carrier family 7 member 13-like [Onychomys torridus]|uniref:solute carrier family 7 member 13-like n=1 Tax=Onychomys torridus TaxID=38674 RepID=UPI00167FBE2E|nr:solute carrier family 7 member 13-like [Onychomys torridus]